MVFVPAGEFTMGSKNGNDDEQPGYTVYLDAFWIDRTEAANEQFAAFLGQQDNDREGKAPSPTCGLANCSDCVGAFSQVGSYPGGASPYR
jgi:formylglycine-generating enzyme required for sulfatase activity